MKRKVRLIVESYVDETEGRAHGIAVYNTDSPTSPTEEEMRIVIAAAALGLGFEVHHPDWVKGDA